jgi:hypothetical protein
MDNKALNTGLTVLAFVIGIVGLIMSIRIMAGYEDIIGPAIWLVFALMIVAAGVAILFGLLQLFTNLKRNISLLIGIIGFAVLALICYNLASDEVLPRYGDDITPSASQLSGMGLMVMYVLVIAAVVLAIIGEITRIFK